MKKRPRTVSWIAWIIIGGAVLYIIDVVFLFNISSKQHSTSLIVPFLVISIIMIIIGIFILKGKNWARLAWLFLGIIFVLLQKESFGIVTEILIDFYATLWFISLLLLNLSHAKAYFRQEPADIGQNDNDSYELDKTLVSQIRKNMENRNTAELVEILKQNDRTQYSKEAFEAISEILKERKDR